MFNRWLRTLAISRRGGQFACGGDAAHCVNDDDKNLEGRAASSEPSRGMSPSFFVLRRDTNIFSMARGQRTIKNEASITLVPRLEEPRLNGHRV